MSLLDRGTTVVTVFPEIDAVDSDGNPIRRPSPVGLSRRATVQPSSDQLAGDEDRLGPYRLRFARGQEPSGMGPAALVVWDGDTWSVHGYPKKFTGSARTAHTDFVIRRT